MIGALLDLETANLKALAAAVQRGELDKPTALNLEPYCPKDQRQSLLEGLRAAHGMGRAGLLTLLQTLVADRERRAALHPRPDLVWSGPDLVGEYTRDTRVVVHELFRKARKQVLVSTYALYQGVELFTPLHEAMEAHPELKVTLYLDIARGDKGGPGSELLAQFKAKFSTTHWPWEPRPEVFYDPRSLEKLGSPQRACLHAKVVVVDGLDVFLTSANLTEAAQQRNIEAGLLFKSKVIATQLADHFDALVKQGYLAKL